jgi:hypothetical protein
MEDIGREDVAGTDLHGGGQEGTKHSFDDKASTSTHLSFGGQCGSPTMVDGRP